jgi:endonuclease/exonuclease/phosphatase family metal-dependent hydrolase
MSFRSSPLLKVALFVLMGCGGAASPIEPDQGVRDTSVRDTSVRDTSVRDTSVRDQAPLDRSVSDDRSLTDIGASDAALDQADLYRPDLHRDLPILDLRLDMPAPDLPAPDLPALDLPAPDLSTPDQSVVDAGGPTVRFGLRIMAANLTSENRQSYDPGHGARIMKALAPDVVLIQEFNVGSNSQSELQQFVIDTFGSKYFFYRESGSLPNGVISRYPIIASGEWSDPLVSNRDFAWARIDLPGKRDLWAISVHLLTADATTRDAEAKALLAYLKQHIPPGALVVLGGDFNTNSRSESCLSTLGALFSIAAPYPADQAGNSNTNQPRNKPYDWVIANPSLDAYEVPLVIGSQTFADGLVFDSRVYQPLSEVPPVLVGDSGAFQMQHMAVVRQFQVVDTAVNATLSISELMINPSFVDDEDGEYIELYNASSFAVDLSGWTISDNSSSLTFGTRSVPANSYFVMARKAASIAKLPAVALTFPFALSNSGDSVTLRDPSGKIIDQVTYRGLPFSAGVAISRDPGSPSGWCAETRAIGGPYGNTDRGTPGARRSCP